MFEWFFQVIPLALLHAMLHSLWQGLVLWLLVTAIRHTMKPTESVMYLVHAAAGFALASLFVIGFLVQSYQLFTAENTSHLQQFLGVQHASLWQIFQVLAPFIAAGYLVAAALRLWQLNRKLRHTNMLRVQSLKKPPVDIRLFAQKISGRMGITRAVKVYMSREVVVPLTIGIVKPIILLPISLVNNLSIPQIEAIIVHELVHIRRHDYLMMVVLEVSERLLLFNPWMKLLCKKAGQYRETSCDEQVLQFKIQARDYAEALLACGGHQAAALAVSATGESGFELLQRIRRVMEQQQSPIQPRRRGWVASVAILSLVLALLSFQWKTPAGSPNTATSASESGVSGNMSAKAMWFWQNLPADNTAQDEGALNNTGDGAFMDGGVLYLTSNAQTTFKEKTNDESGNRPKLPASSSNYAKQELAEVVAYAPLPEVTIDPDAIFTETLVTTPTINRAQGTWRQASLSDEEAVEKAIAGKRWKATFNEAIWLMEQQAAAVAFRLHDISDKELATAQVILEKSLQSAEAALDGLMELDPGTSQEELAAQKADFRKSLEKYFQTIKKMGDEARQRKARASADCHCDASKRIKSSRAVDL